MVAFTYFFFLLLVMNYPLLSFQLRFAKINAIHTVIFFVIAKEKSPLRFLYQEASFLKSKLNVLLFLQRLISSCFSFFYLSKIKMLSSLFSEKIYVLLHSFSNAFGFRLLNSIFFYKCRKTYYSKLHMFIRK